MSFYVLEDGTGDYLLESGDKYLIEATVVSNTKQLIYDIRGLINNTLQLCYDINGDASTQLVQSNIKQDYEWIGQVGYQNLVRLDKKNNLKNTKAVRIKDGNIFEFRRRKR